MLIGDYSASRVLFSDSICESFGANISAVRMWMHLQQVFYFHCIPLSHLAKPLSVLRPPRKGMPKAMRRLLFPTFTIQVSDASSVLDLLH